MKFKRVRSIPVHNILVINNKRSDYVATRIMYSRKYCIDLINDTVSRASRYRIGNDGIRRHTYLINKYEVKRKNGKIIQHFNAK